MNGFEKRSKLKQNDILETATRIFCKEGISEINIRRIARESGVSQASLYKYFGSKEDLINSVINHIIELSYVEQADIILGEGSFQIKLTSLIERKLNNLNNIHSELLLPLLKENPVLSHHANSFSDKLLNLYKSFFDQGRKEGFIDSSLTDTGLVKYLEIFVDGYRKHANTFSIESQSTHNELLQLFLYGLIGKQRD